jgi:hypothetical protein
MEQSSPGPPLLAQTDQQLTTLINPYARECLMHEVDGIAVINLRVSPGLSSDSGNFGPAATLIGSLRS